MGTDSAEVRLFSIPAFALLEVGRALVGLVAALLAVKILPSITASLSLLIVFWLEALHARL